MALELYATRWYFSYGGQISKLTSYWQTDNTLAQHPYSVAAELADELIYGSNYGLALANMLTEKGYFPQIQSQRIKPNYGPTSTVAFAPGVLPGRWPGQCSVNFTTANFIWQYPGDFIGKCQNRVGPIGSGAFSESGPTFPFATYAGVFISETWSVHTILSGLTFTGTALTKTGIYFPIVSGFLHPIRGRQRNRRLVA